MRSSGWNSGGGAASHRAGGSGRSEAGSVADCSRRLKRSASATQRVHRWQRAGHVVGRVQSVRVAPVPTKPVKHSSGRPTSARVHQLNRAHTSILSNVVPRLLQLHLWQVVLNGACMYSCCCLAFAAVLYALGQGCYATDEEFSFAECLWLSVHTFSSVGYGSIYPTCVAGHLVVMVECYVSLVVTSIMSGRILFEVMRPRSRVRFSNRFLLDRDGDRRPVLTFRLVRESGSDLRDATIRVDARFVQRCADGGTKGRRESLQLRTSELGQLEQWQVYHTIDETSPLYPALDSLTTMLTSLEVSLVAFDTAYVQEVRLYASYNGTDCVQNARFVDMISHTDVDGRREVSINHDLLDEFEMHNPVPALRKQPRTRWGHLFGTSPTLLRRHDAANTQEPAGAQLHASSKSVQA